MSKINSREGESKLKVVKYDYTWKIKDFKYWPLSTRDDLKAPEFSIEVLNYNLKCIITLKHDIKYNAFNPSYILQDGLSLCIEFKCDHRMIGNPLNVNVKISVHNNQGKVHTNFDNWKELNSPNHPNTVVWSTFLNHTYIINPESNLLFDGDTLTIFFEFTIPEKVINTSLLKKQLDIPNNIECKIISDLESVLKSEKFSDLIITASCGKTFRVHKAILAARSNVFAAMFENDMIEKSRNSVHIPDIEGKTMHELLHFIYTGKVNLSSNNAIEMIQASDKYGIEDLKLMCENVICQSITIENAVEIFVIANLHSAIPLKDECLNFMSKNQELVIGSAGFQTLVTKGDPNLSEILQHFGKVKHK